MRANFIFVILVFIAFMLFLNTANALLASTDKITYIVNDIITISGEVSGTSATDVTATIYNSSDVVMNSSTAASSGGTPNTFSLPNTINENYTVGDYYITITAGTENVRVNFEVVSERLLLKAHLIESSDVVAVNTSTLINSSNDLGGNFSELLDLSISGTLHYGNVSNLTGDDSNYSFVLVDQNQNNTYDTLYVDDDLDFLLYNYTEDNATYPEVEKILEIGEKFKNYIVGEIEFDTGDKILLGRPVNSSVYSPGNVVNFIVLVKDVNKTLLPNQNVNVRLLDSGGSVINSTSNSTNAFGYFVANFLAPSTTGTYTIDLNNSLGVEFFFVESFKLLGRVSDLADSPMYAFAPDPTVRISATAKDMNDNPINLSSITARVNFPNGSSVTKTLVGSNGLYSYDLDLSGAPIGEYGVKIIGVYGNDQREIITGFAIKAISLDVLAVNPDFISEAEGPEAMVNAFAPGSNVTLLVFLSNVSAGGIMTKGPPGSGGGIIDIDNASTPEDECITRVSLTEVKDDRGVSISVNYTVTNFSTFIEGLSLPEEEGPPPEILRQCAITFQAPNRTGVYKAGVKVTHPLGTESGGETFGIQRLYAIGSSVDFKGEEFWFFAPNTTIRIKLKVIDLNTSEELSTSQIMDGKIIEMYREFPIYADVFTEGYRAIVNESINESTITFTAPDSEGFFRMRFKFKANLSGDIQEGVGNAFFMLKKYMIWGEVAGCQPGRPCIVGVGENITLSINVVDIDKGEMLDLGMSGLTCTGCDGLVADVDMIWNDQLMREMKDPGDYSAVESAVVNSTATLRIVPVNLPTGWYHVDLILTDETDPNAAYFGWAWFEIRNFFIETMPLKDVGGNLTAEGAEDVYGIGLPVLFAVIPRDPKQPEITLISIVEDITVESVRYMMGWPPPEVAFSYNASKRNVRLPWSEQPEEVYVVNITELDKTGQHQANVKLTVTGYGSDIGSFWFGTSTYTYTRKYRGMEEWPPIFGANENLTVNVSAYDFSGNSHNLSKNGTKIKSIWNIRTGRPIRVNSSASCVGNNCTITANLSALGSGEYDANVVLNDTNGTESGFGIYFRIQTLVVNIPKIEEQWIGYRDSGDRELDINNERDRCDNERWLGGDYYSENDAERQLNDEQPFGPGFQRDNCTADDTKVCFDGGNTNFTMGASVTGDLWATVNCLLDNGTLTKYNDECDSYPGTRVGLVTNTTHLWVNDTGINLTASSIINMTGITPNVTGDTVNIGARTWEITNVFNAEYNRTEYKDDKLIIRFIDSIEVVWIFSSKNTSITYKVNAFCVNETWPDSAQIGCSGNQQQIYVVSNATHVWISNDTNLTGVTPKKKGIVSISGNEWYLIDVGRQHDGSLNEGWFRIAPGYTATIISINDGQFNITVAEKYSYNKGGIFCIRNDGEWRDAGPGSCDNETETGIYAVSNTTHLWVNTTANLTGVQPKANGSEFSIAGKNWTVVEIDGTDNDNRFRINHSNGLICGEKWINCGSGGCERSNYTMTPPSNYSNFYHGYVRTLLQNEGIGEDWPAFNVTRDVYIYHNTSYVWMGNDTNFTAGENGYTIGETITDPYGGQWKVMSISKHRVDLLGLNVLGQTGAFINTSLSKIGITKLERIEEQYLGGWDPVAGRDRGMDLDGDGLTNGTVYFAMVDNVTAGVYDTFFFSNSSNLTELYSPMSVSEPNRTNRTFGLNDSLTLLSIEPTGNRVRLYSSRKGDWGDLGEIRIGDNVTIPIVVKSPAGADETVNVSIRNMRIRNSSGWFMEELSPPPNTTITGLGELRINLSALGYTQPGEYKFEITVSKDGSEERLEEWRWPFVTMRAFLIERSVGDGGYISGFQPLNLTRYDWENYGEIWQIYTMNDTGEPEIFGVLLHADRDPTCGTITPPADADASNFSVKDTWPPLDDIYRFGIDATNQTVYADPGTGCNFTEGGTIGPLSMNDSVNLTLDNHLYMLQVVEIRTSPDYNRSAFGFAGVNVSVIQPIRIGEFGGNPSPKWGVMALNLSGTNYNIILANDTAIDYPMCDVWKIDECVKKAWFSTDKNFTNAVSARIGENFTSDLYVSSMGPGKWEGMTIGNKSQIESLNLLHYPAIEARTRDGTLGYFGIANESQLGMDLNKDFVRNKTFYMFTADFKENNKQNLTSVMVDDDLNITDEWWSESNANESLPDYYKDFYDNESGGMREKENGLPSGIWSGNARFGEEKENVSWEYQPDWEVLNYNDTDMLISKGKWEMNESQNITIIVKTYNFDLTPIQNANVSVVNLMRFGAFGASILSKPDDYSVDNVQNVTDQYGYGLVKLIPNETWDNGDYMVALTIDTLGSTEKVINWFRVGSW